MDDDNIISLEDMRNERQIAEEIETDYWLACECGCEVFKFYGDHSVWCFKCKSELSMFWDYTNDTDDFA